MAYVNVPRDLDAIKSKFALGLTASQIGHILVGAVIGVPMFFITRGSLGTGPAMLIMFTCISPFAFLALYEKDGIPAKKWVAIMLRHKIYPQKRKYKTENLYSAVEKALKEGAIVDGQESARKASRTAKAAARNHSVNEPNRKTR